MLTVFGLIVQEPVPLEVGLQHGLAGGSVGTLVAQEGELLGVLGDTVARQSVTMGELHAAELAGVHPGLRQLALLHQLPLLVRVQDLKIKSSRVFLQT